jgi:hypothetical protein
MEPTILTETGVIRSRKQLQPLSLLISTIRESGGGTEKESVHKAVFVRRINEEGYEEYRDAIVDEWIRIKYSTALNAANPPTPAELNARRRAASERAAVTRAAIDTVKAKIKGKVLAMILPNGKRLGSCTGTECTEFGGWLARIGERVGERRVKDVLSETQILKLIAK